MIRKIKLLNQHLSSNNMSEKLLKFLTVLGTVLSAAGELFRQYNQSRKYLELERKLTELEEKKENKSN